MNTTQETNAKESIASEADGVLLAQATVAPEAAVAAAGPVSPLGVLSGASPGVEIVRAGARVPVQGPVALQVGDKVIVPDGGTAKVDFPASAANQTPLEGVFAGGTQAVIGAKPIGGGVTQVLVELEAGDFIVAPPDLSQIESSLAVRKKGQAGEEGYGLLPLALLGLAAAALGSGGGDDPTPTEPPVTQPPVTQPPVTEPPVTQPPVTDPPPADPGLGFLTPTAIVVDNLTDALANPGGVGGNNGAADALGGLGGSLAPVDGLVYSVTDAVNGLVAPLVGVEFFANSPNSLDSVDVLGTDVTGLVQAPIMPVVDTLLGSGTTQTLINPLNLQVDFVSDGLNNLLNGSGLLGGVQGTGAGGLLEPLTGVLGSFGGVAGGIAPAGNTGNSLTGESTPSNSLVPVLNLLDNVSGSGQVQSPVAPLSSTSSASGPALPFESILGGLLTAA